MGRRTWVLECKDCGNSFWKKFEHMNGDEIVAFADNTSCTNCMSTNWFFTGVTEFAGGKEMEAESILAKCRNCYSEWWVDLKGRGRLEIKELGEKISCDECEDGGNPRLSDGIPNTYSIERF